MTNEKELPNQDSTTHRLAKSSSMDTVNMFMKDSTSQSNLTDVQEGCKEKNAFLSVTQITDLVEDLCYKDNITVNGQSTASATASKEIKTEPLEEPSSSIRSSLQAPSQNTSFSFKHFLNKSNVSTPSCTTVCANNADANSALYTLNTNNDTLCTVSSNANTYKTASSASCLQTSTGARPKVPSSTSTSLLIGSSETCLATSNSGEQNMSVNSKMKRSPRFSSFDSQASLVEYAYTDVGSNIGMNTSRVPDKFSGYNNVIKDSHDIFSANFQFNLNSQGVNSSGDADGQHFRRSLSNYEMPLSSSSPRRRMNVASSTKANRPNRLPLNTNVSKFKLDVLIDATANTIPGTSRAMPTNEHHSAASAAALPDFVQDHWMDPCSGRDMRLNSLQNSPVICDVLEDIACEHANESAAVSADEAIGVNVIDACTEETAAITNSKMLPDFLSDGPIIHSCQRLADVALGLPASSMGSPENQSIVSQLSQVRLENERLQRELDEAHNALSEQTIRANGLERKLQECMVSKSAMLSEEKAYKHRKHTSSDKQQISEMKDRIELLTTESEALRRENEELRALGAIGGCNSNATQKERSYKSAAGACQNNSTKRSTKNSMLSRDLRIAAANAESNLKQLLVGVENLRQMAADIENSENTCDFPQSPDLYSNYPDECDSSLDFLCGPEP